MILCSDVSSLGFATLTSGCAEIPVSVLVLLGLSLALGTGGIDPWLLQAGLFVFALEG